MLRLRGLSLDSWLVVALTDGGFHSLRALPGVPCVLAPGHADAQAPDGGDSGRASGGGDVGGGGGGRGGGRKGGGGGGGRGGGGGGAAHGLRQTGLQLGVMLELLKAGFELFACDVETPLLQSPWPSLLQLAAEAPSVAAAGNAVPTAVAAAATGTREPPYDLLLQSERQPRCDGAV